MQSDYRGNRVFTGATDDQPGDDVGDAHGVMETWAQAVRALWA